MINMQDLIQKIESIQEQNNRHTKVSVYQGSQILQSDKLKKIENKEIQNICAKIVQDISPKLNIDDRYELAGILLKKKKEVNHL